MSKYDVNAIREKLKRSMSGKFNDPDEFKPAKANSTTEAIKYRFYVLPPLMRGDVLKTGEVKDTMEHFFMQHGNHWINNRPTPCPRVWDGTECKICSFGFDLLKDKDLKDDEPRRRAIVDQWMPSSYNMVNIFFTGWKGNPEELRGQVKFYNAPKSVTDQWMTALMREDSGDPEDPQAYGVFFDENAAFQFELQVLKQGRQQSYKTSRFLPNGGDPQAMLGEGSTEASLTKLLRKRHNLFDKVERPDLEKISKVFNVLVNGDDDNDDDGGFDSDETNKVKETKVVKENKPKESKVPKAVETKPKTKPKPDDDDDEDVITHLTDDDDNDDVLVTSDDSLDDEAPFSDNDDDGDDVVAAVVTSDDDVDSDELDDLLSQLDDDD